MLPGPRRDGKGFRCPTLGESGDEFTGVFQVNLSDPTGPLIASDTAQIGMPEWVGLARIRLHAPPPGALGREAFRGDRKRSLSPLGRGQGEGPLRSGQGRPGNVSGSITV
jgi:hypothetical protein